MQLTDFDLFGVTPRFNIGGKRTVGSLCGFIVTLVIVIVMLFYAVPKLINVVTKSDFKLSSKILNGKYDSSMVFNTKKHNFRIAFGAFSYYGGLPHIDPKYTRWQVILKSSKQGIETQTELKIHPCAQADWDQFFPDYEAESVRIGQCKDFGAYYCLDSS